MNFQIVNTPTPNPVQTTCVFSYFEANDTTTNLYVALNRYKAQIEALEDLKWRLVAMPSSIISGTILFGFSFVETISFSLKFMACWDPVVCMSLNMPIHPMYL